MKNIFFQYRMIILLFCISGIIILTGCSKDEDNTPDQNQEQDQTSDANEMMEITDEVNDEATNLYTENYGARISEGIPNLCNATIEAVNQTITVTYNGDNCAGTWTRTGVITIKLISGTSWNDVDAKLLINYKDFKASKKVIGKSVLINGSHTVTNISGGNIIAIPPGGLIHAIRANIKVKFDKDNTDRTWWAARKRTISEDLLTLTIAGDSTQQLAQGGINRRGQSFSSTISENLIFQNCGTIQEPNVKGLEGVIVHKVGGLITINVEFGYKLEADNLPIASHNCDATGAYIFWTGGDKTSTAFVSY